MKISSVSVLQPESAQLCEWLEAADWTLASAYLSSALKNKA